MVHKTKSQVSQRPHDLTLIMSLVHIGIYCLAFRTGHAFGHFGHKNNPKLP